jgi:hypothetical protein
LYGSGGKAARFSSTARTGIERASWVRKGNGSAGINVILPRQRSTASGSGGHCTA